MSVIAHEERLGAPGQVEYTITLGNQPAHLPKLTEAEAEAMLQLGFAFSIYRPGQEEFAVSMPYTVIYDTSRGRLTFRQ